MAASMNVTVSAYNRPAYLAETLASLRSCDGIEHTRVVVLCDWCDDTMACAALASRYGFEYRLFPERVGCNQAIYRSLSHGFDAMGSEFHVHLEDDTVPTRDCLRWFAWARDAYADEPAVMNVSAYQRVSDGQRNAAGLRRWFTPWGWGLWRDRWEKMKAGWSPDDSISWDVVVNHVLRAGRYEVFPTVSRTQNIGAEKGTHVPSAEWHAANHWVPVTADDIDGEPVESWTTVRVADYADHA